MQETVKSRQALVVENEAVWPWKSESAETMTAAVEWQFGAEQHSAVQRGRRRGACIWGQRRD